MKTQTKNITLIKEVVAQKMVLKVLRKKCNHLNLETKKNTLLDVVESTTLYHSPQESRITSPRITKLSTIVAVTNSLSSYAKYHRVLTSPKCKKIFSNSNFLPLLTQFY